MFKENIVNTSQVWSLMLHLQYLRNIFFFSDKNKAWLYLLYNKKEDISLKHKESDFIDLVTNGMFQIAF